MYKATLAAAIRPVRGLGACRDEIIGRKTNISLLLTMSALVLLIPQIERRETRQTA